MERKTLKITNDFFDLLEVVNQASNVVEHLSKLKNIEIKIETNNQSKEFFVMIFGDEQRYLQILVNFLSNALKFSPKNS